MNILSSMIIGPVIETHKIGALFYSALLGMNLAGNAVVFIGAHHRETDEPCIFSEANDLVEARAKILQEADVSITNEGQKKESAAKAPLAIPLGLAELGITNRLFSAHEVIEFATTAITLASNWEAVLAGKIKTVDRKWLQDEAQSYQNIAGSIDTFQTISRLALFAEMAFYDLDDENSLTLSDMGSWHWDTMPIYLWCAIHHGLDRFTQADANAHFKSAAVHPVAANNQSQIEDEAAAA